VGTSKEEAQWVLRAQCGDREALESLLRSIQPSLQRYLRGVVGMFHADDVVQDVLVIIARKIAWLEEPMVIRAWAFRIASREAFRHLKKRRRQEHALGDVDLEGLPAPVDRPSADLLSELHTMDGISPASRAVLVLHFQEEMSLPEVAAILEIPLGTAKSRLAYGLAGIRKELAKRGDM